MPNQEVTDYLNQVVSSSAGLINGIIINFAEMPEGFDKLLVYHHFFEILLKAETEKLGRPEIIDFAKKGMAHKIEDNFMDSYEDIRLMWEKKYISKRLFLRMQKHLCEVLDVAEKAAKDNE